MCTDDTFYFLVWRLMRGYCLRTLTATCLRCKCVCFHKKKKLPLDATLCSIYSTLILILQCLISLSFYFWINHLKLLIFDKCQGFFFPSYTVVWGVSKVRFSNCNGPDSTIKQSRIWDHKFQYNTHLLLKIALLAII